MGVGTNGKRYLNKVQRREETSPCWVPRTSPSSTSCLGFSDTRTARFGRFYSPLNAAGKQHNPPSHSHSMCTQGRVKSCTCVASTGRNTKCQRSTFGGLVRQRYSPLINKRKKNRQLFGTSFDLCAYSPVTHTHTHTHHHPPAEAPPPPHLPPGQRDLRAT